ncbi:VOC family protein [Pseudarthrobacter sp. YS3]|uniref:VOC family protein n=1 Tax=Pseudarthrobacter sp. YS3 TaxID=3453718 RepID=UPI003EE9ED8B
MMALDHVTQFVTDRHRTSDILRTLGLHAVPGGIHEGFGSANDLCHFGLFYIELLEITDPEAAAAGGSDVCRYAVDFLRGGDGLATLAMETDNLDAAARRLRYHGYTVPDAIEMTRVHTDGFTSKSRIIYPQSGSSPIRPPIVIERILSPNDRLAALSSENIIADHPAGNVTITYVGVASLDALAAARELAAAYGARADTDLTPFPVWEAGFADVHFERATLRLFQTTGQDNPISEQLTRRGPGPFIVGAAGSGLKAALPAGKAGMVPADITGFMWGLS